MFAAGAGREGTVRLLAELGADVDAADSNGETALGLAGKRRYDAVISVLLSYGASRGAGEWRGVLGDVPLVRNCRGAVEETVSACGDGGRDVARLCGDYVSMVDRWKPKRERHE